ncbi:MAG: hypothetical protein WCJ35_02395 [Planctomycetota bacterium]
MAWEKRGTCGQLYYYRVRRVCGRVVKEYVGSADSRKAKEAAVQDAARKAERTASRQAEQQRRLAYDSIAEQAASVVHELDSMVTTALIAAGFHRPQRKPWRKKRGEKKEVLGRR